MSYLVPQEEADLDGLDPDFVDADPAGDIFPCTGDIALVFSNQSDTEIYVTLLAVGIENDLVIQLPAGKIYKTRAIPRQRFARWYDGLGMMTYDSVSGLSVAAIRQQPFEG